MPAFFVLSTSASARWSPEGGSPAIPAVRLAGRANAVGSCPSGDMIVKEGVCRWMGRASKQVEHSPAQHNKEPNLESLPKTSPSRGPENALI